MGCGFSAPVATCRAESASGPEMPSARMETEVEPDRADFTLTDIDIALPRLPRDSLTLEPELFDVARPPDIEGRLGLGLRNHRLGRELSGLRERATGTLFPMSVCRFVLDKDDGAGASKKGE